MNFYKVDFGAYHLIHYYTYTYFNFFELNHNKYPIGANVLLTEQGMAEMYYNGRSDYKKGDFRLVDHYVDNRGKEEWEYIIGWSGQFPIFYVTQEKPEMFVKSVLCQEIDETVYTPGELQVEFKEPNYSPKDWEVPGVISGWLVLALVWIGAFIFKDWWLRLIIQIAASFYFGSWREKKINEAIIKQEFRKKK